MKVSIYPRNGKLYIRYTIPGTKDQEKFSTGFPDNPDGWKKAEIRAAEEKIKLLKQESRLKENKLYFSEAYKAFIANREKKTNHTTNYNLVRDLILKHKDLVITKYTEDFFFDLKKDLTGKSQNTIANYFNHARTIFDFFIKKRWIAENPVPGISGLRMPIIIISKEHLKLIFNFLSKKDPAFYKYAKFVYLSGFRREEATSVLREHLLYDRKKINIFNSKKNRWELFPMIRGLDKFLLEYKKLEHGERLFKYTPDRAGKLFHDAMKELKLNYTLHDLRRTFGTEEAKRHMPVELMALMRHKDIRTTMIYYVEGQVSYSGYIIFRSAGKY